MIGLRSDKTRRHIFNNITTYMYTLKNSHGVQYCKMQHRYTMYIIKRLNGLNINAADKTSLTLCVAT